MDDNSHPCCFFGNLHTLSLQGMQNISGFVTKSILSLWAVLCKNYDGPYMRLFTHTLPCEIYIDQPYISLNEGESAQFFASSVVPLRRKPRNGQIFRVNEYVWKVYSYVLSKWEERGCRLRLEYKVTVKQLGTNWGKLPSEKPVICVYITENVLG